MTVQPRPSSSFLRGMQTEGGEMGKALKGIVRPRYHAMPEQPEKPRAPVHSTFKRALSSTSPLQPPSPEEMRSAVNSQFRERSDPSKGNFVRHVGITDRFQGEQAIKRWQRGEIEEIDRRMREAIEQLREERDTEREQDDREWTEHRGRHTQARDEARRELGVPEPQALEPKDPEPERAEAEQARSDGPEDVRSYVDDYIAGRGRDSREHEQFASNFGPEIEREFQRRAAEMQRSEPEVPPPLEPDSYVPSDRAPPPPEHDMDFEIGD